MNAGKPAPWPVRTLERIAAPAGARRMFRALLAACLVLAAAGWLIPHHETLEGAGIGGLAARIPGFYGVFGFVACALLVLAAKALRRLLMRPEDYYAPCGVESEETQPGDAREDAP